jgi:hypothetical protein
MHLFILFIYFFRLFPLPGNYFFVGNSQPYGPATSKMWVFFDD